MKKGIIVGLIALVVIGLSMFFYGVSINNKDVDLRNLAVAQSETCEAYFDKMWKVLKQQAGVSEKYAEDFKEIYPKLIEGRYSNGGGQMMQWVQERNPDFDTSLYNKLMNSIEAQREGFFNEQKKLISIRNQHDNLRLKFPSGWVLGMVGSTDQLEITIIKSLKTEKVYESGQENDVELF
jgi:hypothetical protein